MGGLVCMPMRIAGPSQEKSFPSLCTLWVTSLIIFTFHFYKEIYIINWKKNIFSQETNFMIYCIFIFTTVKYIKLNKSFCLKKQNRSCLSNSLKEKQSCLICMVPWKKFRQIDETLLRGHQKSSENVIGISIYNLKMALSPSQTPKTFFTMK